MENKKFDIIIVYAFNRLHNYYLPIIKTLSSKFSIGLLLSDEKNFCDKDGRNSFKKNRETEKKFRKLCDEFGSKRVYVNEKCHCKILLMHHYSYSDDYIKKIEKNIKSDKIVGLFYLLGTITGIDQLKKWKVKKYIAPAKYILDIRKETEADFKKAIDDIHISESGFPYKKYPVFDKENFDIDYIIAFPSPIHFRAGNEDKLYRFLKAVNSVVNQTDKHDKIYIKYHSVLDKHRYFERTISKNQNLLRLIAFLCKICLSVTPIKNIYNKIIYKIGASAYYNILTRNYQSLETLTEYHNLGIELFLPHVRKGLITGNSGSVLHALVNKLPIYNCDSQKDSPAFHPANEPYRIPYCNGKLKFDEKEFLRIPEECCEADLIEIIKEEI
ncbi:MAG: hypothetical protein GY714_15730 [Desulfobacterales bacterium]|nr:hypothetical protein [Desulfobacterales bacterium]